MKTPFFFTLKSLSNPELPTISRTSKLPIDRINKLTVTSVGLLPADQKKKAVTQKNLERFSVLFLVSLNFCFTIVTILASL